MCTTFVYISLLLLLSHTWVDGCVFLLLLLLFLCEHSSARSHSIIFFVFILVVFFITLYSVPCCFAVSCRSLSFFFPFSVSHSIALRRIHFCVGCILCVSVSLVGFYVRVNTLCYFLLFEAQFSFRIFFCSLLRSPSPLPRESCNLSRFGQASKSERGSDWFSCEILN